MQDDHKKMPKSVLIQGEEVQAEERHALLLRYLATVGKIFAAQIIGLNLCDQQGAFLDNVLILNSLQV